MKRRCPNENAKTYPEGTIRKGQDGTSWIVKRKKRGDLYWKQHNNTD
jgi:hypothetical protein